MDLRGGIQSTAQALGINPLDLATAISYETAGTFDPTKSGPTTQWGQHRGLIQFGEPQARQYGVNWDDPLGSQLGPNGAVANYLRDTGVKPGMGLLDIYSAINAGGVGRYDRSDANNGGAPGTVKDKVETQMQGHRRKAEQLLGGEYQPSAPTVSARGQTPPQMSAPEPEKLKGFMGKLFPNATRDDIDRVSLALMSMSAFPTPGMQAQMGAIQDRMGDRREEEKTAEQQNRTLQELAKAGIPEADLRIAASNPAYMSALLGQVAKSRLGGQETDPTNARREYEEMIAMGVDPKLAMDRAYGGTPLVENNVGTGETAFTKKTGEILAQEASEIVNQGAAAQRSQSQLIALEEALNNAPSGAQGAWTNTAANLGIKLEGASDVEVANAIISQLVPAQRPPGSGVMSDADLEMFRQSLPRLINTREGNKRIIDTMKAISEYDMKRGQIARALQLGEITPQRAAQAYTELGNPLEGFRNATPATDPASDNDPLGLRQ